jgi:PAS domain S-box-containing protein
MKGKQASTAQPSRGKPKRGKASKKIDKSKKAVSGAPISFSEQGFRALIENSVEAITLLDAAGKVIYDSPAANGMLGYGAEDWIGRSVFELIHTDDLQDIQDVFQKLVEKPGNHVKSIFRVRHKNGSWLWIEAVGTNLLAEETVGAVVVNYRDITDRKQVEEALHQSGTNYRSLAENSLQGITIFQDQKIVYVNPATCRIYGYTFDEMTSMSTAQIVKLTHPEDRAMVTERIRQRMQGESISSSIELRILRKDGSTGWIQSFNNAIEYNGRPAILSTNVDITERRRAEEALRASEDFRRLIVDTEPECVKLIAPNGGLIEMNAAGLVMIEADSLEQVKGAAMIDIVAPEYREAFAGLHKRVMTGESGMLEFEIIGLKGTRRWLETHAVPLRNEAKRIEALLGVTRDITERKQAEASLHLSNEILQRVNALVLVANSEGMIVYVSPAVKSILGYEPEELMGDQWWQISRGGPLEAQDQKGYFGRVARGEVVLGGDAYERSIQDKWGNVHWISWVDAIGPGNTVVGVGQDVTERKQAEEKIQLQIRQLSALHEIDQAINASVDLRVTLDVFLRQAVSQLNVDAAAILLFNPATLTLQYAAGRGIPIVRNAQVRLDESHAGRAILERKTIHVPNFLQTDKKLPQFQHLIDEGFVDYYAVPIMAKGQVTGVFEIFHRARLALQIEWLDFLETLAGQAAIAIDNAQLFNDLQRSNIELSMAYDATIEGWSAALDLRDKETEGHSQRVTEMTVELARVMGVSETELTHVRRGALLHDMGKLGIPDHILLKPGELTDEEWMMMRKHPIYAHEMLSKIAYLKPALDIPYCHHEKWDGSGYPQGLKGEEIPAAARMFAVVDVWDALHSDRPYRTGWPKEKITEYIQQQSGAHFDPRVVKAFLKMLDEQGSGKFK